MPDTERMNAKKWRAIPAFDQLNSLVSQLLTFLGLGGGEEHSTDSSSIAPLVRQFMNGPGLNVPTYTNPATERAWNSVMSTEDSLMKTSGLDGDIIAGDGVYRIHALHKQGSLILSLFDDKTNILKRVKINESELTEGNINNKLGDALRKLTDTSPELQGAVLDRMAHASNTGKDRLNALKGLVHAEEDYTSHLKSDGTLNESEREARQNSSALKEALGISGEYVVHNKAYKISPMNVNGKSSLVLFENGKVANKLPLASLLSRDSAEQTLVQLTEGRTELQKIVLAHFDHQSTENHPDVGETSVTRQMSSEALSQAKHVGGNANATNMETVDHDAKAPMALRGNTSASTAMAPAR